MPPKLAHKPTEDIPVQKTTAPVLSTHAFLYSPVWILRSVCREERMSFLEVLRINTDSEAVAVGILRSVFFSSLMSEE